MDIYTRPILPQRAYAFFLPLFSFFLSFLLFFFWSIVHRFSNLSDFLRIFCRRPRPPGKRRVDSRPSSASKNCLRFFLSSIPRHRLCFCLATSVLTLIPGDPSTRVVALVTCRKCFSSMREIGSRLLSPDRCVFRFVFFLSFTSFLLFWGGTPCGERGVHRDVQRRTGDFPGNFLGGRGPWRTGCAPTTYAFLFSLRRRGHEPQEFRIRPDAAGTERSINFIYLFIFFFRWFGGLLS